MSILHQDSVLVIGAGVSVPFGVSMGGDMISEIRKGLHSDRLQIDGEEGRYEHERLGYIRHSFNIHHGFWSTPYFGTVLQKHFEASGQIINLDLLNTDLRKLRTLIDLLDGQTSETIDDFIVENSSYSSILKACIAVQIMQCSYIFSDRQILPTDYSARHVGKNKSRNWVHLLINLVRQGIRTGELGNDHRVKIVSFNYDGILEQVLTRQFQNTESEYGPYTDYIEIVHPHGLCGNLNLDQIRSAAELYDWSSNICVVNEADIQNQKVLEARSTARNWIARANKVYAVGFAFSAPNCNLLGMRKSGLGTSVSSTLHYCNYDGNAGVSLAAKKCARFSNFEETQGQKDAPISVEDWFYGGYLGEFAA